MRASTLVHALTCSVGTLWVLACHDSTGSSQFEPKLGAPFTPAALDYSAPLTWTPSGNELIYGTMDRLLRAFRPSDGNDRIVDPHARERVNLTWDGPLLCLWSEELSPPPAGDVDSYECIDPDGGAGLTLTDRAAGRLAVGPDSLIAYSVVGPSCRPGANWSTCDSLFLYNTRTATDEYLLAGWTGAISPDGNQVFYDGLPCDVGLGELNNCPHYILDLPSRQSSSLSAGPTYDLPWLTRWDASGLWRVAIGKGYVDTLVVRNFLQGTTRNLLVEHGVLIWPSPALSGDNRMLAFWVQDLATYTSSLRLVDLTTGVSRTVAAAPTLDTGNIALTSHGTRIAYIVGSQGYWADLP